MAQVHIEKLILSNKDREKEEQKRMQKKKSLLILMYHYLQEYGYIQAANVLKSESRFPVEDYAVCDNISLELILQDFESYYFLKYQKLPQMTKKLTEEKKKEHDENIKKNMRHSARKDILAFRNQLEQPELKPEKNDWANANLVPDLSKNAFEEVCAEADKRILDPLGGCEHYSPEWKIYADIIMQDVCDPKCKVDWEEIVGHARAKQILKEAIVYPIKYENVFSSLITPWKGILLYGPPGTGKTLLAQAAVSECKATFFNVTSSTLLSKWRGESEKLIKVLFDLAKYYTPSIIFIDEIDSLLSHRGNDHEASKRLKTEFFLQIDGLQSSKNLVLVLAATNIPWELDQAILRRLEKRILIPLPSQQERVILFRKFLPPVIHYNEVLSAATQLDYEELAKATTHYSAADIELLCKETKMSCIRNTFDILEKGKAIPKSVCIEPISNSTVLEAVRSTKPSSSDGSGRYKEWDHKHGSL